MTTDSMPRLGFIRLDALRYGMMAACLPRSSSSAGSSSDATPSRASWRTACTSLRAAGIVRVASRIFTGRSGRTPTGRSLTDTTSTTTTATRSTTIRPTSSASPTMSTWLPTLACPGSSAPSVERSWTAFGRSLRPGIERMRGALGIASMAATGGLSGSRSLALAFSAGSSSTRSLGVLTIASARTPASPRGGALPGSTTNSARALPAARPSRRTATAGHEPALAAVLGVFAFYRDETASLRARREAAA